MNQEKEENLDYFEWEERDESVPYYVHCIGKPHQSISISSKSAFFILFSPSKIFFKNHLNQPFSSPSRLHCWSDRTCQSPSIWHHKGNSQTLEYSLPNKLIPLILSPIRPICKSSKAKNHPGKPLSISIRPKVLPNSGREPPLWLQVVSLPMLHISQCMSIRRRTFCLKSTIRARAYTHTSMLWLELWLPLPMTLLLRLVMVNFIFKIIGLDLKAGRGVASVYLIRKMELIGSLLSLEVNKNRSCFRVGMV